MLYGIKNVEVPDRAKDKARLVLMGNLRFTREGKLLLDKWFRSPGEFWAPASSMAGLRFVASLAVVLNLPLETIDLDSAYLQTKVKTAQVDYLELVPEVLDAMTPDWKMAVQRAREEDFALGGKGEVVFPLVKNMYGKTPSGKNFIEDLQSSLEKMGWRRMPHCPGSFLKLCPVTGKPMVIANYVDDFAAVMTDESRAAEWAELAKSWKFDAPQRSTRFLGIEMYYPDPNNLRHLVLHQGGYLQTVVERYEKARKKMLHGLKHLPNDEPRIPEATFKQDCDTVVRSAIGGLAYAARGTRPDLMKSFHTMSRLVTKWGTDAEAFLQKILAYAKHSFNQGIVLDARKTSADRSMYTCINRSFLKEKM